MVQVVAGKARADTLVTLPNTLFWTGPVGPAPNETFGYSFAVGGSPISVTALGLFGPNFATAHSVGLWDTSGILLASVVIPPVNAEFEEGRFGYVTLSSAVTLAAHHEYILGASYSSGDGILWLYVPTVNPADVYIYSSAVLPVDIRQSGSPGFSFPSLNPLAGGAFGPNAKFHVVPEPGPFALVLLAGAIAFLAFKFRSRKRLILTNRP